MCYKCILYLVSWNSSHVVVYRLTTTSDCALNLSYSLVVIFAVSHTILLMLVRRIWEKIFFLNLITCLLDIVFTSWGEILFWSLMGVKGLVKFFLTAAFRNFLHLTNKLEIPVSIYQQPTLSLADTPLELEKVYVSRIVRPRELLCFLAFWTDGLLSRPFLIAFRRFEPIQSIHRMSRLDAIG